MFVFLNFAFKVYNTAWIMPDFSELFIFRMFYSVFFLKKIPNI